MNQFRGQQQDTSVNIGEAERGTMSFPAMTRSAARIPRVLSIGLASLLFLSVYNAASPLHPDPSAKCREVKTNGSSQPSVEWSWILPNEPAEKANLNEWCETVGPALFRTGHNRPEKTAGRILVVDWNLHVGNGHLEALIDHLRIQENTAGWPQPDFVFLLQESFRRSAAVPQSVRFHASVPSRISAPTDDIDALARKLDWWMFYVPSMRNGDRAGTMAEDRGNAILSSIPLESLQVVELPFGVQRRVVAGAVVHDDRRAIRFRVATLHLDTRAPLIRGFILGAAVARNQQARSLAEMMGRWAQNASPLILGGDLNSYWGPLESSVGTLSVVAPHVSCGGKATHISGFRLDHVFVRPTSEFEVGPCQRLDSRFGSDHYPLVLAVGNSQRLN
jgi:endonuclease/exonuclease/phosphatase family metal-dependent hydrolase